MILQQQPRAHIREYLEGRGFVSLYRVGAELVANGITSQAELDKVAINLT
jgi:type II secretory ATPase GspE/PulE/Tfp pilus assembly ATPase PilB-like protein